MKFYQERIDKHKDFLRVQKFKLLKEINNLQNKLLQIESKFNIIFHFKLIYLL